MKTPFGSTWTEELARRSEEQRRPALVTAAVTILGAAIDAGIVSLPDLLDLVRSCATTDQLGDALTMLATTAPADDWPPVGWPPAPAGRFRVVGERED